MKFEVFRVMTPYSVVVGGDPNVSEKHMPPLSGYVIFV
jgi:hypothetical protein